MSLNVLPFMPDDALQAALLALRSSGPEAGTDTALSEVDAKIEAAEARTDTKFAELLGELRLMNARLDHVEKSTSNLLSSVIVTVVGTGVAIIGVVIAVMAFGGRMFSNGLSSQTIVDQAVSRSVQSSQPRIEALDAQSQALNTKVDRLSTKFDMYLDAIQGNHPLPQVPKN